MAHWHLLKFDSQWKETFCHCLLDVTYFWTKHLRSYDFFGMLTWVLKRCGIFDSFSTSFRCALQMTRGAWNRMEFCLTALRNLILFYCPPPTLHFEYGKNTLHIIIFLMEMKISHSHNLYSSHSSFMWSKSKQHTLIYQHLIYLLLSCFFHKRKCKEN